MKGYKGFKPDMTCNGFKFEEGKTYKEKEAKLCSKGFHFCENPLDIFNYYDPASIFREIEAIDVSDERSEDSKRVSKSIKIGAEISLKTVCDLGVKFILEKIDWNNKEETNTGNYSASTNTGYRSASTNTGNYSASTNTGNYSASTNTGNYSASTNTGDRSASTNTGDRSASTVEGKESVAMAIGYQSKAKGALGCWIVLSEWEEINNEYHIIDVQCVKVDGKKIKDNTWYKLEKGEFVVC